MKTQRNSYFHPRMLKILWGRSGNSCAFPGCSQILVAQSEKEDYAIIGDMAHIIAASQEGPRGKSQDVDPGEVSNIILLCPTHHRLIDQDPASYPPEELRRWKQEHEKAVIDSALSRAHPVVCGSLLKILKPELPEEPPPPKRYIPVRFKSIKLGYEWEYQVDADATCEEFANALAEQHFSPFTKSFQWFLSDESGRIYPPGEKLGKVLPDTGSTVLLRMTYAAQPLDPARGLPHDWQYWTHELACSGDFLQYIKKWENLVRKFPNDMQHLNMLAWMYGEANVHLDRAEELLQRCFALDSNAENDPAILDTLGWVDYRMRRYELAEWKLRNSLDQTAETDDGYYVTLYHLYFTWQALGWDAPAITARKRIHEWLSDYGQDMLMRKRVAQNDDSLLIPSCRYLDPQWLNFFGITRSKEGWWQLNGTP